MKARWDDLQHEDVSAAIHVFRMAVSWPSSPLQWTRRERRADGLHCMDFPRGLNIGDRAC